MEGLGTAAALINVTQLTGKIIAILYDYQRSSRHAHQDISAVKRALQELRDILEILEDEQRKVIVDWLDAPDPSTNYNEACRAKHSNTGLWVLEHSSYTQWKNDAGQPLWLHGISGCGKTILSSSIIQEMITNCRSLPDSAPAYFYFDFRELRKRTVDGCLRSLISQLVSRKDCHSPSLDGLYERCERGRMQPTNELLLSTLREILQDIPETFIILDALDECGEVEHLLASISELLSRTTTELHMLFTSRHQRQIAEAFDNLPLIEITVNARIVDVDIGRVVEEKLSEGSRLGQWPTKVKDEIKSELLRRSNGMYV
ncbi:MAG: hypothetical protein L6R38_004232 [Xanthoria sp. 2 TBL-2021]|nr:MAG: hypothetical protein L6R38_004232 [Xanthoria sp. 2 TBL-2021]